jgi:hypothetical protein
LALNWQSPLASEISKIVAAASALPKPPPARTNTVTKTVKNEMPPVLLCYDFPLGTFRPCKDVGKGYNGH